MTHFIAAELERAFSESKAREHIKEMLKLLQADDARWVRSHSLSSDKDVVYPCLDSFLSKHMMRELCSRAMKDYPRGTMATVLATAASLMRYIRFPLLPHQSVHVPLAQLITHAMRISNSSLVSGNSDAFLKYKHKIDYNLVALVSTLWRKLSENPNLLEFFLFVDKRRSVGSVDGATPESIRRVRSQLDAIGCLIPLMGKTSIGAYAKQAILTAVAMKDHRIESFIVVDTNLLDIVVTELCRKYQRVLDVLTARDRLTLQNRAPQASGAVSPVRVNPLAGLQQTSLTTAREASFDKGESTEPLSESDGQSVASALDAFLRLLRFCSALRDSSIADYTSMRYQSPISVGARAASSPDIMSEASEFKHGNLFIRIEIEHLFKDIFLNECSRTAMLPSCSEQQVLSVQLLIRQIIQSLTACHIRYGGRSVLKLTGPSSGRAPTSASGTATFSTPQRSRSMEITKGEKEVTALNEAAANFFMDNTEFMSILVSRAGAMSKAVVISTLQLISNLLSAASFNSAVRCLLAAPWVRCSSAENFEPYVTVAAGETSHGIDAMLRALIERPILCSGEAGFSVCLGFRYSVVPSAYVDTALKRLMSRIFSFSDLETFFDISDSPVQYNPMKSTEFLQNLSPEDDAATEAVDVSRESNSLLTVIFKKMLSFLTLKFDEQIALTGIVSQISCLVATLLSISIHEPENVTVHRFDLLWHLNQIVEKLFTDIHSHLQSQVPNFTAHMEYVQIQLRKNQSFDSDVGQKDVLRRPKELDNPRVYRAVETAVLVEELMFESRSYVIAAFALRSQSVQAGESSSVNNTPSTPGLQSPLTPQMSPPFSFSPVRGFGVIANGDDLEIEEDIKMANMDSELNSSCLSQLDILLKEMETDVQELELEYRKLGTTCAVDSLLLLDSSEHNDIENDASIVSF